MAMATQEEYYMYCIWLPFQCTSQGPSYFSSILQGRSPPPLERMVAKVGITKNPAERLYDIYTVFQEFGEPRSHFLVPFLQVMIPKLRL